jgi:ElaB/YqjD/DUF883 family membrane-anchored ribosome-binding protein
MARFGIRDADALAKETTLVSVGAGAAALATTALTTLPLAVAAIAGALFGASLSAALTRSPLGTGAKGLLGIVGGTLTALGFAALSTRFGLGDIGFLAGGALGGVALGALLSIDGGSKGSQAAGALLGGTLGAVGAEASLHIARFAESTEAPAALSSTVIAALFGLWVTAGAGARRIERVRDALLVRAEALLRTLATNHARRVANAVQAYHDIEAGLSASESVGPATSAETREHARSLLAAILDTAESLVKIEGDLARGHADELDARIEELAKKSESTTDTVTLSHLARAQQALRAQRAAVEGLAVGRGRADAALDAQLALVERLRLAVAQYQASDRERFALELAAVSEQVSRLSDDLDSLTSAIAEAEAFSDRRLLADIERTGRRALGALSDDATVGIENEQVVRH